MNRIAELNKNKHGVLMLHLACNKIAANVSDTRAEGFSNLLKLLAQWISSETNVNGLISQPMARYSTISVLQSASSDAIANQSIAVNRNRKKMRDVLLVSLAFTGH